MVIILKLASRILIVMVYPIDSPNLMTDFLNVAALHNMFHSVIISDAEHSEEIPNRTVSYDNVKITLK